MARKRKKHSTHRRRRVSGITSDGLQAVGLAVVAAIIGRKVSSMLAKSTNTTLSNLSAYTSLALGVILPMLVKNAMLKQASVGLLVDGSISALQKLAPGIVSGPYRLPVVSGRGRMNGGVYSPGQVGKQYSYSPANNSAVSDTLKIVSGIGSGALC